MAKLETIQLIEYAIVISEGEYRYRGTELPEMYAKLKEIRNTYDDVDPNEFKIVAVLDI